MAIESVVARTYDLVDNTQKSADTSTSASEFKDVVDELIVEKVAEKGKDCDCNIQKASVEGKALDKAENENSVMSNAVAFSFSMFVSISGSFDSVSQEIGRQFEHVTSQFMHGLHNQGQGSQQHVDSYLNEAEQAVTSGQNKIGTFFEQMQATREYTLQSSVDSESVQSIMSNVDLSTDSSLPGTSGSDLAKIYLDAAVNGQNTQSGIYDMGGTSNLSSGITKDEYGLQIVSSSSSSLSSLLSPVGNASENKLQQENIEYMDKFMGMMDAFINQKQQGEFVDRAVVQPSLVSVEFGFDIHRYSTGLFNFSPNEKADGNIDSIDEDSVEMIDKATV